MGLKNALKSNVLGALNPLRWLGIGSLKQQSSRAGKLIKGTFKTGKQEDHYKPTSFEDCMQHYNVTEQDLEKLKRNAHYTSLFCVLLSVVTFAYMFYLFASGPAVGGIMCFVLTILLWAMAIRESFNLFQMKQRRLGCTFKEWFKSLVK